MANKISAPRYESKIRLSKKFVRVKTKKPAADDQLVRKNCDAARRSDRAARALTLWSACRRIWCEEALKRSAGFLTLALLKVADPARNRRNHLSRRGLFCRYLGLLRLSFDLLLSFLYDL